MLLVKGSPCLRSRVALDLHYVILISSVQFASLITMSPAQIQVVEVVFFALLPLAVMLILLVVFAEKWIEYIHAKFFLKEGFAMIGVELPKR